MKKTVISVMAVALLVCLVFAQASFAATKSDILTEAKKSPIFHYVEGTVTKMMEQVPVTSEQADQVIEVIKKVNAVVTEDKGPGYIGSDGVAKYTDEEHAAIVSGIEEICAILGVTIRYDAVTAGTASSHDGDIVVKFFYTDSAGDRILLGSYDGDLIKDTSSATTEVGYGLVAVSAILAAAAVVAFVYGKKKVASR